MSRSFLLPLATAMMVLWTLAQSGDMIGTLAQSSKTGTVIDSAVQRKTWSNDNDNNNSGAAAPVAINDSNTSAQARPAPLNLPFYPVDSTVFFPEYPPQNMSIILNYLRKKTPQRNRVVQQDQQNKDPAKKQTAAAAGGGGGGEHGPIGLHDSGLPLAVHKQPGTQVIIIIALVIVGRVATKHELETNGP